MLNHYVRYSKSYATQQHSAEAGLQLHSIQGLLALVYHSLHYSLLYYIWHLASLISVICLTAEEMYLVTLAKA